MSRGELVSAPGRLLGRGRDADVYDIGDGKVLRRYRVDYDHTSEIGAMRHLHEHGFPVPRLFSADGADMIVERVDGPTMLDALVRYTRATCSSRQVVRS